MPVAQYRVDNKLVFFFLLYYLRRINNSLNYIEQYEETDIPDKDIISKNTIKGDKP